MWETENWSGLSFAFAMDLVEIGISLGNEKLL
jgi:hypothetical protein